MAWTIEYDDSAQRALRKLDRQVARRIVDFMDRRVAVHANPRELGERLAGHLREYWRFRVGEYRLLCHIEDRLLTVIVVEIGHRSDIYR